MENELLKASIPADRNNDQELREKIFTTLIRDRMLINFKKSIEKAGFTDEQYEQINKKLNSLSEENLSGLLSYPFEIRQRLFEDYKERIDNGDLNIDNFLDELISIAEAEHYTLGYHVSEKDIPKIKNRSGQEAWDILPYEVDDRDDMPMAYYSTKLSSLYSGKPFKHIYIVRAQIGPDSAHKMDNKDNWGRAPRLSIVDKLDINRSELNLEIEKIIEDIKSDH